MAESQEGEIIEFPEDLNEGKRRGFPRWNMAQPSFLRSGLGSGIRSFGLGFVAGMFGAGLLGVMMTEAVSTLGNLLSGTKFGKMDQVPQFGDAVEVSGQGLSVALISAFVGLILGHATFTNVTKKRGEEAKERAWALAAVVAVVGTSGSGGLLGLCIENVCNVEFTYIFLTYFVFIPLGLIWFYSEESTLYHLLLVFLSNLIITYVIGLSFSPYGIGLTFTVVLLLLYSYPLSYLESECGQNDCVDPFSPGLIMLMARHCLSSQGENMSSFFSKASASRLSHPMVELVFTGVMASLMFEASMGALYASLLSGRAGRTSAGAVAIGGAALLLVLKAAPIVGAGATLGALLGPAGAGGAALSAAGRSDGAAGRAGAALGAAAGALVSAGARDSEFGIFVALCAAGIPGLPFVRSLAWLAVQCAICGPWRCLTCGLRSVSNVARCLFAACRKLHVRRSNPVHWFRHVICRRNGN